MIAEGASLGPDARPSGMFEVTRETCASDSGLTSEPEAKPGSTMLTRMPKGANSIAIPLVSRSSAVFEAQ